METLNQALRAIIHLKAFRHLDLRRRAILLRQIADDLDAKARSQDALKPKR